ncbi:MAG: tetratricopeptide repeat protein [Myxococcales bacterium]|nr:tetratricopeptide repeat protein [Myxococcales bacterium]
MMTVNCEKCGGKLEVDERQLPAPGKLVKCPSCASSFIARPPTAGKPGNQGPLDFGGDDRITPDAPLPGSRPGILGPGEPLPRGLSPLPLRTMHGISDGAFFPGGAPPGQRIAPLQPQARDPRAEGASDSSLPPLPPLPLPAPPAPPPPAPRSTMPFTASMIPDLGQFAADPPPRSTLMRPPLTPPEALRPSESSRPRPPPVAPRTTMAFTGMAGLSDEGAEQDEEADLLAPRRTSPGAGVAVHPRAEVSDLPAPKRPAQVRHEVLDLPAPKGKAAARPVQPSFAARGPLPVEPDLITPTTSLPRGAPGEGLPPLSLDLPARSHADEIDLPTPVGPMRGAQEARSPLGVPGLRGEEPDLLAPVRRSRESPSRSSFAAVAEPELLAVSGAPLPPPPVSRFMTPGIERDLFTPPGGSLLPLPPPPPPSPRGEGPRYDDEAAVPIASPALGLEPPGREDALRSQPPDPYFPLPGDFDAAGSAGLSFGAGGAADARFNLPSLPGFAPQRGAPEQEAALLRDLTPLPMPSPLAYPPLFEEPLQPPPPRREPASSSPSLPSVMVPQEMPSEVVLPDESVDVDLKDLPVVPADAVGAPGAKKGPRRARSRLRLGRVVILGGAVVVLIALVGGWLALFTNIFNGRGWKDSKALAEAHQLLGVGDVASYRKVAGQMGGAADENPEDRIARAIEIQARCALALAGIAAEGKIAESRLADLGDLSPEDPDDVAKARALGALVAGKPAEAEQQLLRLLTRSSSDANAHTYLGWVHLEGGRFAEAEKDFVLAVSEQPSHAAAQFGLARSLEWQGKIPAAIDAYQKAVKLDPQRLASVVAVERLKPLDLLLSEKRVQEQLAKLGPVSGPLEIAEAWTLLGVRAQVAGRNGEAEDRFKKALALDPASVHAKVGLSRMLSDGDRAARAVPFLEAALKKAPQDLDALYGMVQAQLLVQRPDQAEVHLKNAFALAPKDARTAYWQGRLEEAKGGPGAEERSAARYKEAIAADPRFIDAYVTLSNLHRKTNPAEARITLAKAEEIAAADPPLRNKLGEVYLALGDASRAESYFRNVMEKAPTFYKARMNLSAALEAQDHLDEADATLVELEKVQKGYPGLAERHAGLTVKRQHLEDAAKLYDQAIAEGQPRASLLVAAALVNFKLKIMDKAKREFEEAVVDDPRSADAHLGLALIALVGGHGEEATYESRRSLSSVDSVEAHLAAGEAAEMLGRGDVARDEFTVAAKGATEFEARMGLARLLVKSGAVQDALLELERVTKLDPSRAEPLLLTGDCYEELSELGLAQKAYENAVRRDLKNGEAAFKLGRNLKDAGKRGIAAELLERAVKLGGDATPYAPEAILLAGDARRDGKQLDLALRNYRKYMELSQKHLPERKDVELLIKAMEKRR